MILKSVCLLIHPLLIYLVKSKRKKSNLELHILNEHPSYVGKSVIYAVNHSCKDDFLIVNEVIGRHTCVLAGKQKWYLTDFIGLILNGVIWVDRESHVSKKKAFNKMCSCLNKELNLCIFLEALWNLTPSKPMLPMYWGVIDLAKQSEVPIIPIVLEFRENICYAKFGKPIYCLIDDSKQKRFKELADAMATLKWNIWELFPVESRNTIDMDEWDKVVKKRLLEYPLMDYENEKRFMRC